MTYAEQMNTLSKINAPEIRIKKNIYEAISKAAKKGEFSERASCDTIYEPFIYNSLKNDGFQVKTVLHEAGRTIFEVRW